MTTFLAVVLTALLSVTALLALIRLYRGPSLLDRVIAADMLLATMVGAVGAEAAVNRHATTLPVLVVLSLLGFVGSVSLVRFAVREERRGLMRRCPMPPDWLGAVCLVAGALLSLAAGIGVLRFPDALDRMHAATKPQVLGVLLLLLGLALRLRTPADLGMIAAGRGLPAGHRPGGGPDDRPGRLPVRPGRPEPARRRRAGRTRPARGRRGRRDPAWDGRVRTTGGAALRPTLSGLPASADKIAA